MASFRHIALAFGLFLLASPVLAQQAEKQNGVSSLAPSPVERSQPSLQKVLTAPFDTLRNFDPTQTPNIFYAAPAIELVFPIDTGFVYGTNRFLDVAKATRLTLPQNRTRALVTEVNVWFSFRSPTATNETYDIEIYEVDDFFGDGGPGDLLASQTFNLADIPLNEEALPEVPTVHVLDSPVEVPEQFFIAINFGIYDEEGVGRAGVFSSPLLDRRVEEDWELILSDNTGEFIILDAWSLMSDNWFENGDDGWYMWAEAVVDYDDGGGGGNNDPDGRADIAQAIAYGTLLDDEINPVGDVDYFRFEGQAGDIMELSTRNTGADNLDGLLQVYDADGNLIAETDDIGEFTVSFLRIILPQDGSYFIRYSDIENDVGFPGKRDPRSTVQARSAGVEVSAREPALNRAAALDQALGPDHALRPGEHVVAPAGLQTETGAYTLLLTRRDPGLEFVAGSGFDGLVPIDWPTVTIWNDLLDDTSVSYDVYRSTSASGPFTLLQSVTASYLTDIGLSNGTTYYYQLTINGTGTGNHSSFSSTISATPNGDRAYDLSLDLVQTTPSIDGQIEAGEWDDARQVDITSPFLDGLQPVTLWLKNDDRFLYIAIDNLSATGNSNEMGLYFDRDNNDTWEPNLPSEEGNYWIDDFSGAVEVIFRPIAGDYPTISVGEQQTAPPGIDGAISTASGHVQYEVAVDLSESNVRATPGHTLGLFIFARDGDDYQGLYPPGPVGGVFSAPSAFADVTLASANAAPTITPDAAPDVASAGADLAVSATVADDVGLARVSLLYRPGGTANFTEVGLTDQGTAFQGAIPAADVTSRGLQYYLEAEDVDGLVTTTDLVSVRVRSDGDGLSTSVAASGDTESAYRLVSLPIDLEANAPRAVFEDDFGVYDSTMWRFFSLAPDQSYTELFSVGSMQPGRAYWLAVRESGSTWDTGVGTSVALDENFEVPLNAGWTFVATPFDFDWPQSSLTLESGAALDLRSYSGTWQTHTGALRPFAGYAAFATEADVLRFAAAPSAKRESAEEVAWELRVVAQSGSALDVENSLGVSPTALAGWDGLDRAEPPVIGRFVSLAFPHPEWGLPVDAFQRDIRPEIQRIEQWELDVITNVAFPVDVRFEGVEGVPEDLAVWVVDDLSGMAQDVRMESKLEVSGGSRLRVLVGSESAVRAEVRAHNGPEIVELLESYPNPLSGSSGGMTTLRYGVQEATDVVLTVYDVLGKRIAVLVEGEEHRAGYHTLVWNGRDGSGRLVANGLYLCELRVGNRRMVHKLVVSR